MGAPRHNLQRLFTPFQIKAGRIIIIIIIISVPVLVVVIRLIHTRK